MRPALWILSLLAPLGMSGRLLAEPVEPQIKETVWLATEKTFGAIADGVTDNAPAFQAAIRAAAKAGGGIVKIPAADKAYASGPLTLASGVHLLVEKGATLAMLPYQAYPGTEDFITLGDLHDVKISGGGLIDGQGAPWWKAFDEEKIKRPKAMVAVVKGERIAIENITLRNPPNTHVQLRGGASQVRIVGVIISAPEKAHNTDGIDVSGRNVLIERCNISCGDDNIAIGGSSASNENITIRNCDFGYGHGLSIGSYTSGGVRNLSVEDCRFVGTMSGIRMKSGRERGGLVENLSYTNITMTNVEKPIFITSYYPDRTIPNDPSSEAAAPVTSKTPIWRNISIKNLTSRADAANKRCSAGMIWGVPEMPVGEIVLENVSVSAPSALIVCNAALNFRGSMKFESPNVDFAVKASNSLLLVKQPESCAVSEGSAAKFEVAIGDGNIFRQEKPAIVWSHNGAVLRDGRQPDGTEISGADTPRLVLGKVTPAMNGSYAATASVQGSGARLSVKSKAGELTVK